MSPAFRGARLTGTGQESGGGSFAYRPGDFDEAIEHLAAGRVPAEDLISSRIPLSGAADAFVELLRPETSELKTVLQPALAA